MTVMAGRAGTDNGWVVSAAKATADGGATARQVFTSRLKGRPLVDSDGLLIGRVSDVVLLPEVGDEPPRALGLVVALRRRSIFVGFGRIGELSIDGAHLLGGTVDLDPFTQRTGEIMASGLYGRHAAGGIVADVAIVQSDPRPGWEVSAVAIRRGLVLRSRSPEIVPWQDAKELFDAGPVAEQLTSLREMEPADLAAAVGRMPAARRGQLAAALDDEELADLLEELPEQDQVRLLDSLELERSADVVEEMQPDDAADLLAEMPAEQRERLLLAMRSVQADELRRLLLYDAKTAGGLMTSQPLVFTPDTPVAEVLARVRDKAQPATLAAQVYVCEPPAMHADRAVPGQRGFPAAAAPRAVHVGRRVRRGPAVRPAGNAGAGAGRAAGGVQPDRRGGVRS